MTLPPFDGPRARQATATLPGEGGTGLQGRPGSEVQELPERPRLPGPPLPEDTAAAVPGASVMAAPSPPAGADAPAAPGSGPPRRSPASPEPENEALNLARRPFVNVRPVERLATILWVLGVVLLVADVTLFMGYLTSSQTTRVKLANLEREIAREQSDGAELQRSLGKLGLDQQNREVIFLNRKIDERTFSWSLLFDRMAEVLPHEVRLLRLKPSNVVERDIGLGSRPSPRELKPLPVTLTMNCEAKDDEAVLRFVDNLFAHPAFSEPNLEREDRLDSGALRFDVTVQYQPNVPAGAASRPLPARASRQSRRPAAAAGSAAHPAAGAAASSEASPPAAGSPAGAGLVRVGPPPLRAGSRLPPTPRTVPPQRPMRPKLPMRPGRPGSPGSSVNPGSSGAAPPPTGVPGEGGGGGR
jgi:Tfp pilus assembly protein PilN